MGKPTFSVIVPNNAERLLALATTIVQKHQQDGTASKVPAALAEQLQAKLPTAYADHHRRNDLDRQKEKRNEERNLILGLHHTQNSYTEGTVRYLMTAARDILLGQYRGNERQLGDWGYTVDSPKDEVRVVIPRRADALIVLAKNVMQKHNQDSSNSPLQDLDWNALYMRLAEAEQKLEEGRKLSRDKENATQARNLALGTVKGQTSKTPNTVKYLVKSIRDVLLGTFRGREQELGAWGFEVNSNTITDTKVVVNPAPVLDTTVV